MAGHIPDRILEEIRFRNDIVDLISEQVPLKRSGATYKACCPFHREKTPSFNVNPNMQIFKCFGCGEGGDVITFVMKSQGLEFMDAVKYLAARANIELELQEDSGESQTRKALFSIHDSIARFYQRCLDEYPGAEHARGYVKERGLDNETAKAFGVGYAPDGWNISRKWAEKKSYAIELLLDAGLVLRQPDGEADDVYDRFRDRLMFPIRDVQGRTIGFSGRLLRDEPKQPKYVNSPETMIFRKSRVLFGLDQARRNILGADPREAIVCEGQVDVIRCHQYGLNSAVAAQGTAFTPEHAEQLRRYADGAVLLFDADHAGQAAAIKTAHVLMKAGMVVRIATLPEGDDPDSFLIREGGGALGALLSEAVSVVDFQIDVLSAGVRDVRDVSTTSRIAKAVLETVMYSPNAVQRDRLLQSASARLGISQKALETDLQDMARSKRVSPRRTTSGSSPAQPSPDRSRHVGVTRSPSRRHETAEQLLCLMLVRHDGDLELCHCVEHFLPLRLIQQPLCRLLVEHLLAAWRSEDAFVEYLDRDVTPAIRQQLKPMLEKLEHAPMPTGSADTVIDALRDVVLKIWHHYLQQEYIRLADGISDATGEAFQRCNQIKIDLNSLKHWDTGQDVILTEIAMLEDPAASVEPDPPATDSEA